MKGELKKSEPKKFFNNFDFFFFFKKAAVFNDLKLKIMIFFSRNSSFKLQNIDSIKLKRIDLIESQLE